MDHCCVSPCVRYKGGNKVFTNCGTIIGQIFVDNERRAYNGKKLKKEDRQNLHGENLVQELFFQQLNLIQKDR